MNEEHGGSMKRGPRKRGRERAMMMMIYIRRRTMGGNEKQQNIERTNEREGRKEGRRRLLENEFEDRIARTFEEDARGAEPNGEGRREKMYGEERREERGELREDKRGKEDETMKLFISIIRKEKRKQK